MNERDTPRLRLVVDNTGSHLSGGLRLTEFQTVTLEEAAAASSGYVWRPKTMEKLAGLGLVRPEVCKVRDASGEWSFIAYYITERGRHYLANVGSAVA